MPLLLIFQAQLISLQEMELYPILVGLIIRDISRKQVIFFGHWKQVSFCGLFMHYEWSVIFTAQLGQLLCI